MAKPSGIEVDQKSISILEQNSEDYIWLTDMVSRKEDDDHIRNWMLTRNMVEFIGFGENPS